MKTGIFAAAALVAGSAAADMTVGIPDSSADWRAFMNVSELDGTPVFGSGWGVGDLRAQFDDANSSVTMLVNTIGDPDPFWYIGGGGPGAQGNKIMEANLFQERTGGELSGMTVTFSGFVTENTLTDAHEARIFIRDFASDFSSFNETIIDAEVGAFSISLDTIDDSSRFVQWGFQMRGENVWITDAQPFGSVTYSSIPAPASAAVFGLAGLAARRRR